jgi:hypothetical protein
LIREKHDAGGTQAARLGDAKSGAAAGLIFLKSFSVSLLY